MSSFLAKKRDNERPREQSGSGGERIHSEEALAAAVIPASRIGVLGIGACPEKARMTVGKPVIEKPTLVG
jgi:hypothetical protein